MVRIVDSDPSILLISVSSVSQSSILNVLTLIVMVPILILIAGVQPGMLWLLLVVGVTLLVVVLTGLKKSFFKFDRVSHTFSEGTKKTKTILDFTDIASVEIRVSEDTERGDTYWLIVHSNANKQFEIAAGEEAECGSLYEVGKQIGDFVGVPFKSDSTVRRRMLSDDR